MHVDALALAYQRRDQVELVYYGVSARLCAVTERIRRGSEQGQPVCDLGGLERELHALATSAYDELIRSRAVVRCLRRADGR